MQNDRARSNAFRYSAARYRHLQKCNDTQNYKTAIDLEPELEEGVSLHPKNEVGTPHTHPHVMIHMHATERQTITALLMSIIIHQYF